MLVPGAWCLVLVLVLAPAQGAGALHIFTKQSLQPLAIYNLEVIQYTHAQRKCTNQLPGVNSMGEYQYREQAAAAYGAYVSERARWVQVLGTTGKRKQVKPVRVSLLAWIISIFN